MNNKYSSVSFQVTKDEADYIRQFFVKNGYNKSKTLRKLLYSFMGSVNNGQYTEKTNKGT